MIHTEGYEDATWMSLKYLTSTPGFSGQVSPETLQPSSPVIGNGTGIPAIIPCTIALTEVTCAFGLNVTEIVLLPPLCRMQGLSLHGSTKTLVTTPLTPAMKTGKICSDAKGI